AHPHVFGCSSERLAHADRTLVHVTGSGLRDEAPYRKSARNRQTHMRGRAARVAEPKHAFPDQIDFHDIVARGIGSDYGQVLSNLLTRLDSLRNPLTIVVVDQ